MVSFSTAASSGSPPKCSLALSLVYSSPCSCLPSLCKRTLVCANLNPAATAAFYILPSQQVAVILWALYLKGGPRPRCMHHTWLYGPALIRLHRVLVQQRVHAASREAVECTEPAKQTNHQHVEKHPPIVFAKALQRLHRLSWSSTRAQSQACDDLAQVCLVGCHVQRREKVGFQLSRPQQTTNKESTLPLKRVRTAIRHRTLPVCSLQ